MGSITSQQNQKISTSSGASSSNSQESSSNKSTSIKHPHRSIISDIFDGKLLSSVQCLTCDRISTREETFQDLSLPIPGKDHLAVLHQNQSMPNLATFQTSATCSDAVSFNEKSAFKTIFIVDLLPGLSSHTRWLDVVVLELVSVIVLGSSCITT